MYMCLQTCDMCDAAAGSVSSYAYVLMLLHYLQIVTPPVIPVLQQVQHSLYVYTYIRLDLSLLKTDKHLNLTNFKHMLSR